MGSLCDCCPSLCQSGAQRVYRELLKDECHVSRTEHIGCWRTTLYLHPSTCRHCLALSDWSCLNIEKSKDRTKFIQEIFSKLKAYETCLMLRKEWWHIHNRAETFAFWWTGSTCSNDPLKHSTNSNNRREQMICSASEKYARQTSSAAKPSRFSRQSL